MKSDAPVVEGGAGSVGYIRSVVRSGGRSCALYKLGSAVCSHNNGNLTRPRQFSNPIELAYTNTITP